MSGLGQTLRNALSLQRSEVTVPDPDLLTRNINICMEIFPSKELVCSLVNIGA